jgi:ABC-type cobalamin/Fe3+-siderophores transport system ATPase subunit
VSLAFVRGQRLVVPVLEDVSLELELGDTLCVLAQPAQGKTTLLRVAAGILKPNEGRVCFEGQDLWACSARHRSGLLANDIALVRRVRPDIDLPVIDTVMLPLQVANLDTHTARTQAITALQRVGATHCADQHWDSLADWEQTLVAIASAIARQPKLVLVDDLTGPLGMHETDKVTALLAALSQEQGFGILMCVCDSQATGWSHRLATLAGGNLLHTPPHDPSNIIDFPQRNAASGWE